MHQWLVITIHQCRAEIITSEPIVLKMLCVMNLQLIVSSVGCAHIYESTVERKGEPVKPTFAYTPSGGYGKPYAQGVTCSGCGGKWSGCKKLCVEEEEEVTKPTPHTHHTHRHGYQPSLICLLSHHNHQSQKATILN